jgi:hypothetical protein
MSKFSRFPSAHWCCIFVAFLLIFPSFFMDFFADDFLFLEKIEGRFPFPTKAWNYYDFISPDREIFEQYKENNIVPWWSHPELRFKFFRPLSSLLFALDYQLFGRNTLGYHLHCFFWLFLLLWVFGLLLQRFFSEPVGVLALWIYTLSSAYLLSTIWVSNRHALISIVPVFWGLWFYLRYREDQWRPGFFLAYLGYTLGLLGGETALSALFYVGFYEILLAPGSLKRRFLGLLPLAFLGVLYITLYRLFDCGTFGSGFYLNPLSESSAYFHAGLLRFPAILADAFLKFNADLWMLSPDLHPIQALCGAFALGVGVCFYRLILVTLDSKAQRTLHFFALSSLFSILPGISTIPMNRLLVVPFFGISALLASFFIYGYALWKKKTDSFSPKRFLILFCFFILTFLHFVLAPLGTFANSCFFLYSHKRWKNTTLDFGKDLPTLNPFFVIIPATPDYLMPMYAQMTRSYYGYSNPQGWFYFSMARYDQRLSRIDSHTLEIEVLEPGALFLSAFEELWKSTHYTFQKGQRFSWGKFRIEIQEVRQTRPCKVRFSSDTSWDDPLFVFYRWTEGHFERFEVPAQGESVLLPFSRGPTGI